MIWRCRATPNAYAVCTLYNTTQWNNVKREQNATTIIIFATVKINRKTEHDKPIVTNNLNGCWMIRWHWSCRYGIAIDIVIICDEVAQEERRQTGERKWMKIKRVFIFVSLYFEFDIYLGWKYTCNSHCFTERTLNIITHMCVHCTGCAQHIHMHHRHHQHNTHTMCEIFMTVFRSRHVNGVGVSVRARIDNENTKPIKIAIIVAYNKTTLCTLWVYTIYISSISYFPI